MNIIFKLVLFIVIFGLIIILMTRNGLLPSPLTYKSNHYYGPPYLVTGRLGELGYMFCIDFENATWQPTQKTEYEMTEIYFGSGILMIVHEPLNFQFFPELSDGLKLTVTDLSDYNQTLHFGSLTESDGMPSGMELWYENIHSKPIIEGNNGNRMVTFIINGVTRVITIDKQCKVDMTEDLKAYITVADLNKY